MDIQTMQVWDLAEALVTANTEGEVVRRIVDQMGRLVPFGSVIYMPVDPHSGGLAVGQTFGCDPKYMRMYIEEMWKHDPFVLAHSNLPPLNVTMQQSRLRGVGDVRRTPYHEFMRAIELDDALGTPLGYEDKPLGILGVHRKGPNCNFKTEEVRSMQRICRLAAACIGRHRRGQFDGGLIVYTTDGKVAYADTRALQILSKNDVKCVFEASRRREPYVSIDGGQIGIRRVEIRGASLFAQFAGPMFHGLVVTPRGERVPAEGCTLGRSRYAVRIREQQEPPPSVQEEQDLLIRCGLTQREAQVGALMIQGYQDKEIASSLEITPGTIKSHWKSLSRKLAIHNRRELGRIVLDKRRW